ncbi:hypothetical protein GCM10010294_17990 [Streptomyces griseoloalbus]|uniref:hypothetical protein n=1 Tax=Streptomyces griseoloalbus TaxID=67303 RepID=UPI001877140A|nr:hypothetical protein GCM10010294_17990 [Streptomyces griseoloalbus]
MPPNTPPDEPPAATGRTALFRGRHRKPRPRKALLAAGGLALAAGAVSLVRLASAPDGGAEAAPRPVPHTDTTTHRTAPTTDAATPLTPEASPSSPTALGGKNPTPLTPPGPPPRPPAATTPPDTAATTPATPLPPPPTSGPPPTPHTHTPGPPPPAPGEPAPERPDKPAPDSAPVLCVPIIGLCVGDGPDLQDRESDRWNQPD